jgi:DNA-binding transcriptional regulator YiaG
MTVIDPGPAFHAPPVPNDRLRAVRVALRLSQDEFARKVQDAGHLNREPNDCSKRLVQRWEAGVTSWPRGPYARALETVTGQPIERLGFTPPETRVSTDGRGGHDVDLDAPTTASAHPEAAPSPADGDFGGIWLSQYQYFSSGREDTFTGAHYVLLLQRGNALTVRSLPGATLVPGSTLTMELTVHRNVLTGTWSEETSPTGYYRGAVYHGAIQMLAEPTGRRLTGKWIGFGKDMDINSGPWELAFQTAATNKSAIDRYSRSPDLDG